MKVHEFTRGLWEQELSLTLGCKRLRPTLALDMADNDMSFDLKSFIRPETGSKKLGFSDDKRALAQVETQSGGTRWNPTQEQIGILEMLYRGGLRTPNAQQIEQITTQLVKYGKIEGKNIFYWFQNHKARERQKQKRHSLGLSHCPRTPTTTTITSIISQNTRVGEREETEEDSPYKKKCRSWGFESLDLEDMRYCKEEGGKTLELFPLHPEGK